MSLIGFIYELFYVYYYLIQTNPYYGKIPISKIEEQVAPEHWEDIDFAINFDK